MSSAIFGMLKVVLVIPTANHDTKRMRLHVAKSLTQIC